MMKINHQAGITSAALVLLLSGCSGGNDGAAEKQTDRVEEQGDEQYDREQTSDTYDMHDSEDREEMEDGESGDPGALPGGLKEAQSPTYPVGSEVVLKADHMPGMQNAKATVTGAYETTAYAVTYTPTDGGKPVKAHKWVIHEELKDPGKDPVQKGSQVTIAADHMDGMKGATGIIDDAEKTTVYQVDFVPEDGGEKVKNHKWVIEEELSEES
ncbi:YdhK family protein [Bhargavaea ullalensis]|uniref:DUF1541 domain-containing protein n=1 Tax=Bhargavaea ullalensis TaxID=1265685 RepID=A0ABV2GDD4_9BACL